MGISRNTKPDSSFDGWASLHQWISRFLEDKTTPRKIVEWHGWARNRMKHGWDRETIERRIRDAWREHQLSHDERELEADLQSSLRQVYELADKGWTPAQCAVVYRSLLRSHPTRYWLNDWAERWEAAGNDWKAIVLP